MKRMLAILLTALLVLTGCGASESLSAAVALPAGEKVTVGAALSEEQRTALGEPFRTEQAPSCHFEGMDTIYVYDGFSLYTYREGDADVLYLLEITGAGVKSPEGIRIGDTAGAVQKACGEPDEADDYTMTYSLKDGVTLNFYLTDGAVSSFEYVIE